MKSRIVQFIRYEKNGGVDVASREGEVGGCIFLAVYIFKIKLAFSKVGFSLITF
jgi:hypothetical protein